MIPSTNRFSWRSVATSTSGSSLRRSASFSNRTVLKPRPPSEGKGSQGPSSGSLPPTSQNGSLGDTPPEDSSLSPTGPTGTGASASNETNISFAGSAESTSSSTSTVVNPTCDEPAKDQRTPPSNPVNSAPSPVVDRKARQPKSRPKWLFGGLNRKAKETDSSTSRVGTPRPRWWKRKLLCDWGKGSKDTPDEDQDEHPKVLTSSVNC
jgi:hypothetical protein